MARKISFDADGSTSHMGLSAGCLFDQQQHTHLQRIGEVRTHGGMVGMEDRHTPTTVEKVLWVAPNAATSTPRQW